VRPGSHAASHPAPELSKAPGRPTWRKRAAARLVIERVMVHLRRAADSVPLQEVNRKSMWRSSKADVKRRPCEAVSASRRTPIDRRLFLSHLLNISCGAGYDRGQNIWGSRVHLRNEIPAAFSVMYASTVMRLPLHANRPTPMVPSSAGEAKVSGQ
jgi:hypothetical protein